MGDELRGGGLEDLALGSLDVLGHGPILAVVQRKLEEEIARAFDNVERTLGTAGATWRDVVSVDSFHLPDAPDSIGEAHGQLMVEQFRKRMGDRSPIWTMIGVAALAAPKMRVEIRVTAVVGRA
ncbi:Rid family hydrolase [Micromonospora sp. WMMD1102]|uniref:Rid family hydrolase n=1 Tax=Micromonospora sp. WMMD1102 TaxID=3016105 RepID=UPI002414FC3F|nr:Rid family hydrolase [Micromonospora sp. WMMD1102]MDG4786668.1 Rid family hydrolase [Micromonospora sp. WMMD1102]